MILLALLTGYFIGVNQQYGEESPKQEQQNTIITPNQESNLSKTIPPKHPATISTPKEKTKKTLVKTNIVKASHEYSVKDKNATPPLPEKRIVKPIKSCSAKLVIIIDDVSYSHDVEAIASTHLPLVMSFLPPTSKHPQSATLAQHFKGSMVHLPLEAISFDDAEPATLLTTDSQEEIDSFILKIKKLYPNVRYINNHTGSKFTSDKDAVERLMKSLWEHGFIFVDSRTSSATKVKEVLEKNHKRYLGRDVFLDHHDGVANIKKQIREAVATAKSYGSAIAIGHPRPDTIQALKESKEILSEVQLVGIDKI